MKRKVSRVAVGQQLVEQGVELVLVAQVEVGAGEIGQGGALIPEAPAAPFAAGGDPAVGDGDEPGLGPVGAFTGPARFFRPERVQAQEPPQFEGQPAIAVSARPAQGVLLPADLHCGDGIGRRCAIVGEEAQGLGLLGGGGADQQGLGPGGLLTVVEFAEIKERALAGVFGAGQADPLDHGEVTVCFAVFAAFGLAQTPATRRITRGRGRVARRWVFTTRMFGGGCGEKRWIGSEIRVADPRKKSNRAPSIERSAWLSLTLDWQGGAVHSFTDWNVKGLGMTGAAYNEPADRRSWKAMQQFLVELFGEPKAASPATK